jgi:1,4-alpha-glucan branching enzyme
MRYITGLKREIFCNARLCGTWDGEGKYSDKWSETPMQPILAEDGCPAFVATVHFDSSEQGKTFKWGVRLDTSTAANLWGITTEIADPAGTDRYREFVLKSSGSGQTEDYYFTYGRRFGARKVFLNNRRNHAALRFSVWAPNARKVDVVFGLKSNGYIADDGFGIDPARPPEPLSSIGGGVWQSEFIPDFQSHEGLPYMYRIENAQGKIVYRTDLYSRQQMGRGTVDPRGARWTDGPDPLDGTKSCSVIVSTETVARDLLPNSPHRIADMDFWATEFTPGVPVPSRFQDMVVYELHIGALGCDQDRPGNLEDAIKLLPHLSSLGINAVELLPMSEFSGIGWGYGDSHLFVVESSAGGRDQYKHFVRECHRRGIAVIQDVVYNHFDGSADRAEWAFDSETPEDNIYYWYEGKSADYLYSDGGYLDNGSTGYTPRFRDEKVRQFFVSSAAAFIEVCHVDGLRVDLTQAIHRDNVLHADGRSIGAANQFGAKMLREWSRTLRLIKPSAVLIAEDHSGWDKITQLPEEGGLGFDATWYAAFYHNLIGDSDMAGGKARLLKNAGLGYDDPLDMAQFAGALYNSQFNYVVYHESHDEAGNSGGSMRTLPCAVNGSEYVEANRVYAEARARVAFGLSLFSAGTPMFFMGEEIGALKPYKWNSFMENREDIIGGTKGNGAKLFRFYQDVIRFSRRHDAVRAQMIDIVHVNNEARVIAFRRLAGTDQLLVVATFSNHDFPSYRLQTDSWRLPDGGWTEVFNSNAELYSGTNTGNGGATLFAGGGSIEIMLPGNALLVFAKT